MNLPNKLTILRIILIPFILVFMLPLDTVPAAGWNQFVSTSGLIISLVLFCIAAYTDHLDGAIARKRGLITNMGKFLDPIADKLLVISVLIAFTELGRINSFVAVIVLLREFSVSGLRMLAATNGKVIAASMLGKVKTVTQIIAIILVYLDLIIRSFSQTAAYWTTLNSVAAGLANLALAVMLAFTLLSGADYLLKNRSVLQE